MVTRGDKVYSYFKWDRKTNYKENLLNTLGIWELPQVFAAYQGALGVVAVVNAG